jgi:hypothetical protein
VQVATLESVKSDHAVQFRIPEPCADGKPLPSHKVEWWSTNYTSGNLNLRSDQVRVMNSRSPGGWCRGVLTPSSGLLQKAYQAIVQKVQLLMMSSLLCSPETRRNLAEFERAVGFDLVI